MNQTEVINYALDLQTDYNIKFIFLILVSIYALYTFYYWKYNEPQYMAQYYLKMITLILARIWFIALPLWIFFLYRTVAIDTIFQPMIVFYGIAGVGFFIYMFLYGGERIKNFFSRDNFYRRYGRK